VARAQQRVRAAAPAGVPEAVRAGTTLTAALVAGDRLHLAHVGDSSCWLYRRGLLRRLTEVHTTAAVLVAAGVVERGSAAARRLGNLLTRYLGMPGPLEPQLCTVRLHAGDRLLLASDGLTGALPPQALALLLARPQATAADLAADAVARGCRDDVTVVLAAVAADYAPYAEVARAAEPSAAPAEMIEVRTSSATGGLPTASQSGGRFLASGR
jgi:protein phosphatase